MFHKKSSIPVLGALLGCLLFSHAAYTQDKVTTTEATTTQTTTTPGTSKKAPSTTVTSTNTSATVTKEEPTAAVDSRTVMNEEMLERMAGTLCSDGFKAYVGSDKRNICQGKAMAPDLAYSCVWNKDGTAAYAPTPKGPCNLDFTEHRGSIVITKSEFNNPPLAYGVEAQCCFRAAQSVSASH